MRRIVIAGVAAAGLVTLGAGIPSVMAGIRSVPKTVVPQGWPAQKASGYEAENQSREQAAGRPLVAPGGEGPAGQQSGAQQRTDGPSAIERQSARQQSAGQLTAGIVPLTSGGPFSQAQFTGTNLWNGPVGGRWEVVQAGSTAAGQAGLYVYTRSSDPASSSGPKVVGAITPAGDPAGTFTIEKASGGVLTLALSDPGTSDSAASGNGASGNGAGQRQYTFDVTTLKFGG
jgi:hypothetical protein